MQTIFTIAIALTLLTSFILIIRFRNIRLLGTEPVPFEPLAIVFTSGLEVTKLQKVKVSYDTNF